jgi:hypothetical protein
MILWSKPRQSRPLQTMAAINAEEFSSNGPKVLSLSAALVDHQEAEWSHRKNFGTLEWKSPGFKSQLPFVNCVVLNTSSNFQFSWD